MFLYAAWLLLAPSSLAHGSSRAPRAAQLLAGAP
jgi:hypothetical protein